jgi:hypothetical protein
LKNDEFVCCICCVGGRGCFRLLCRGHCGSSMDWYWEGVRSFSHFYFVCLGSGVVGVLWAWLATGNVWSRGSGTSPADIIVKELRLNLHIRALRRAVLGWGKNRNSFVLCSSFPPTLVCLAPSLFSSAVFKTGHCDVKVMGLLRSGITETDPLAWIVCIVRPRQLPLPRHLNKYNIGLGFVLGVCCPILFTCLFKLKSSETVLVLDTEPRWRSQIPTSTSGQAKGGGGGGVSLLECCSRESN